MEAGDPPGPALVLGPCPWALAVADFALCVVSGTTDPAVVGACPRDPKASCEVPCAAGRWREGVVLGAEAAEIADLPAWTAFERRVALAPALELARGVAPWPPWSWRDEGFTAGPVAP